MKLYTKQKMKVETEFVKVSCDILNVNVVFYLEV